MRPRAFASPNWLASPAILLATLACCEAAVGQTVRFNRDVLPILADNCYSCHGFDAGKRQTCSVNVTRTNSPLHALSTLNDITYVEAARAMAQRVMTEAGPSVDARLVMAFRLATARRPSADELAVLRGRNGQGRSLLCSGDFGPVSAPAMAVAGKRDQSLVPPKAVS